MSIARGLAIIKYNNFYVSFFFFFVTPTPTKELETKQRELKHKLRLDAELAIPDGMSLFRYQMELSDDVKELTTQLSDKMTDINVLIQRHERLCDELDIDVEERVLCVDPLPTETETIEFGEYLNGLANEKSARFDTIEQLKIDIERLSDLLEFDWSEEPVDYRLITETVIKPSNSNIIRLRRCYDMLMNKKQSFEIKINEMKEKLVVLWSCLEESAIVQHKFMSMKKCTQVSVWGEWGNSYKPTSCIIYFFLFCRIDYVQSIKPRIESLPNGKASTY